jgi:hypothetical protein
MAVGIFKYIDSPEIYMNAKLICYTLGKLNHTKRSAFKRKLNGFVDVSNNGGYKYKRNGILQEIQHFSPIRSVLIVKDKDKDRIIQLLKEYQAIHYCFDIKIPENQLIS